MPSVKRSETSVRKYGGKRENLELLHAIEFLFQIKGLEYKKFVPDFTIPSAHEFLEFSNNPNKLRKSKPAEECMKFWLFIVPTVESNRELLCVSIVVLAIVLYNYTGQVIEITMQTMYTLPYDEICRKATERLQTEEGLTTMIHPLSYFFTYYLTKQNKTKDYLYSLALNSIRKTVEGMPYLCSERDIMKQSIPCVRIGQKLMESIQTIFTSYMKVVGNPIPFDSIMT